MLPQRCGAAGTHLRARRSSAFVPPSFGPPAVSRSDVTRPLPPRWELVLPPPEVVDDARLYPGRNAPLSPPRRPLADVWWSAVLNAPPTLTQILAQNPTQQLPCSEVSVDLGVRQRRGAGEEKILCRFN